MREFFFFFFIKFALHKMAVIAFRSQELHSFVARWQHFTIMAETYSDKRLSEYVSAIIVKCCHLATNECNSCERKAITAILCRANFIKKKKKNSRISSNLVSVGV